MSCDGSDLSRASFKTPFDVMRIMRTHVSMQFPSSFFSCMKIDEHEQSRTLSLFNILCSVDNTKLVKF